MFGLTRSNPFDDIFNFQREMDRVFNQFWNDLPTRTASAAGSFQVDASDDGWQVNVPLPGIDPQYVNLEVAGETLSIRAEVPEGEKGAPVLRYEQTLTVPEFLDTEKLTASHNHGMLQLTLPLRESVKPRKVQIESKAAPAKTLAAGAGAAAAR